MNGHLAQTAAKVIQYAGGVVVGRTRLQKLTFLMEEAGIESGFPFIYKHYGPYSEALSQATQIAGLLGLVKEIEKPASWGGSYSTFSLPEPVAVDRNPIFTAFARLAAQADAIVLELAATALFLAKEGFRDPWGETARRKPEKADSDRLQKAQALYNELASFGTPVRLTPL